MDDKFDSKRNYWSETPIKSLENQAVHRNTHYSKMKKLLVLFVALLLFVSANCYQTEDVETLRDHYGSKIWCMQDPLNLIRVRACWKWRATATLEVDSLDEEETLSNSCVQELDNRGYLRLSSWEKEHWCWNFNGNVQEVLRNLVEACKYNDAYCPTK
jgi:hypothetical protein